MKPEMELFTENILQHLKETITSIAGNDLTLLFKTSTTVKKNLLTNESEGKNRVSLIH